MNEIEFLKDQLIKLSLEVFECKKDIKNLKDALHNEGITVYNKKLKTISNTP